LTSFAISKGLVGMMTWDADNDARGVDGNAQWAYSLGIINMCKNIFGK
jgi:GH18 family chitinase